MLFARVLFGAHVPANRCQTDSDSTKANESDSTSSSYPLSHSPGIQMLA